MKNMPLLWEDEKYRYISQEAFKHLPEEIREEIESYMSHGDDLLTKADADIQSLNRLGMMMPAVASLRYIYSRLRTTQFEPTMESAFEQEMLTTAFVVTYSRLFVSTTGASRISEKKVPKHLKPIHSELIEIRNQRYAHNGGHESISSSIHITFDGTEFDINFNYELGMHIGGRDEWEELIKFVNEYVYDQIFKILNRLRERTGHPWNFPHGPATDFGSNSD
ncbi:hypothetical protein K5X92_00525 [Enterobacter bugandensis]|uniref:hypothetical protein n=1 Tax=Enterobacter bugandensis TaxID=881260 RepID=UPI001C992B4B|nr:hypothetical protein [Enterobacter bugandensis]MBY6289468.1 hypothetical protein [Enterobacter bugandensis]